MARIKRILAPWHTIKTDVVSKNGALQSYSCDHGSGLMNWVGARTIGKWHLFCKYVADYDDCEFGQLGFLLTHLLPGRRYFMSFAILS